MFLVSLGKLESWVQDAIGDVGEEGASTLMVQRHIEVFLQRDWPEELKVLLREHGIDLSNTKIEWAESKHAYFWKQGKRTGQWRRVGPFPADAGAIAYNVKKGLLLEPPKGAVQRRSIATAAAPTENVAAGAVERR